ncbi:MAG: hypothetical protein J6Y64_04320 [Ruminococcus sp.]|nr:hypothetical protein [Ruminococcus sp.]
MRFKPDSFFRNIKSFFQILASLILVLGIFWFGVEGIYLFIAMVVFIIIMVWIKVKLIKSEHKDIEYHDEKDDDRFR